MPLKSLPTETADVTTFLICGIFTEIKWKQKYQRFA